MATHSLDDIPTISLLYRLKRLLPAEQSDNGDVATPSSSFNDKISVLRSDITRLEVDAIVNAANNSLLGGGGVDGAIHRAAGPALMDECYNLDGCNTGDAKITNAYELPCKKVIHAVGPVYSARRQEQSASLLESCYTKSLQLAVENQCKSVAFSALSTGVYGYPSRAAANVSTRAVRAFLEGPDGGKIDRVIFVTFERKDVVAYEDQIPLVFPPTQDNVSHEGKEEEWEEVEKGESAQNGVLEAESSVKKSDVTKKSGEDVVQPELKAGQSVAGGELPDAPNASTNNPASYLTTITESAASDGNAKDSKISASEKALIEDLPNVPVVDPTGLPDAKKVKTSDS